jgi:hypothetical protein
MSQYNHDNSAPKIQANSDAKTDKKIEQRIKKLTDQVEEQQRTIDRMHRDIVRLRVAINEVAARIK